MDQTRCPAVAGQFYPGHPDMLRKAIAEAFLSRHGPGALPVVEDGPRRLVGLVVPHAGYPYSAAGAAWAYAAAAADGRPQAVVLLGVNHRAVGTPVALSPAAGWETPLGVLPVAKEIGARLSELNTDVALDAIAHAKEHSLEVQAPFLQAIFGVIAIIPILLGRLYTHDVLRLGQALASLMQEFDLLLVASTDFSHYVPHREAEVLDHLALQEIADVNPEGLMEVVLRRNITMCGVLPVAAMLEAARLSGVRSGKVLHYHTSGDITGDREEVVGYGAAALYRE